MVQVQRIAHITNDLRKFVLLGHVFFINLPLHVTDLYAPPVTDDDPEERWADLELLTMRAPDCHPLIKDMAQLQLQRYIMCTFKVVEGVARLSVYALPADDDDIWPVLEWRKRPLVALRLQWYRMLHGISVGKSKFVVDFRATEASWEWDYAPVEKWVSGVATNRSEGLDHRVNRIYNLIEPPKVDGLMKSGQQIPTTDDLIIEVQNGRVNGVKTRLYGYQRQSVSAMLQRELASSRKFPVPHYVEFLKDKYYDLLTDQIFNHHEEIKLPRGGILAENMGLGKTLICIAVICATKHQQLVIPPQEDMITFPLEDEEQYSSDDELYYIGDDFVKPEASLEPAKPLPRLTQLCLDQIRDKGLPWKFYVHDLPPHLVELLHENPAGFQIAVIGNHYDQYAKIRVRQSSRIPEFDQRRKLWLSSLTLVVVPDNLFHQWNNEIDKHTDPLFLKKVYILTHYRKDSRDPETNSWFTREVPSIAELLRHDVVVTTSSFVLRLVTQNKGDMQGLELIYWKRLIVDEGHSLHTKSRTSDTCSNVFMCERKWAVSGTPTLGLTHLSMAEEEVRNQFDSKQDLGKLGVIIGRFLRLEPYFSSPRLWHNTIIKPLEAGAPLAELALGGLLNQLMIRHADVDMELPPLHHKVVYLKPLYFNQLAINNFTAVLATNAVSSEREDIDYMFHPKNQGQLRRLINNLRRATVFWTGFLIEDLEALVKVCTNCLNREETDPRYSASDILLLEQSRANAEVALNNQRWRVALVAHELLYYLDRNEIPLFFVKDLALGATPGEYVLGAPQLGVLQEVVYKNRFALADKLREKILEAVEKFNKQYSKEGVKRSKKFAAETEEAPSPKRKKSRYDTLPLSKAQQKQKRVARAKATKIKTDAANQEQQIKLVHEKVLIDDSDGDVSFENLRKARLLGTALSKLSYLASRLAEHQRQGLKLIVFFDFEDHAYYLAELLDVLGLDYILYATFISPHDRAINLEKFSDAIGGTALIMDLRLASHGLTIIDATRVYFLSPVWQKLVEAQAIKRAHRIGQRKPVYVETLLLRDTLEEEMYRHRTLEDHKEKFVIDNYAIQQYIQRHQFLDLARDEYIEFEATPTTDKDMSLSNDTDGGLLTHCSEITFDEERVWQMWAFSQENLARLNQIKAQIKEKEESRKRWRQPEESKPEMDSKRPRTHKKVRF